MGKVIGRKGAQLGDSGAEAPHADYTALGCIVSTERAAQSGKLLCTRSVICFFQSRVSPRME